MKRLHLLTVGVMCYVLLFNVRAQLPPPPALKLLPNKASLFSRLPEKFDVSNLWLQKLFAGPDTGAVNIPISPGIFFNGFIVEKVRMNPNVTNINIKSLNFDGALLSVSKITYSDLTTRYTGRIVSINYGDVYILAQENNTMYFKKKKQSLVITE